MSRPPPGPRQTEIRIENARSHNLKGVSCRIPLRRMTVVTGVSGSGKSTLAFDTLYAEGQRRYVGSLSTYARQFLEQLPRPVVDSISNLPPAIAIEQRNPVTGARSTVGTATEILDHLRLLFAKIGESSCPDCAQRVQRSSPSSVTAQLLERLAGRRITIAAPLAPLDDASGLRDRLLREGYRRLVDEGDRVVDLDELDPGRFRGGGYLLLIDRMALPVPVNGDGDGNDDAARARLSDAIAQAFARGHGEAVAIEADAASPGPRHFFREGFRCDACGRAIAEPVPALFSFNSPLGACEDCQGFGRVAGIDWGRVVPDPAKTLAEVAIAPFATRTGSRLQRELIAACRQAGVPTDAPFQDLRPDDRDWVLEGARDNGGDWHGVRGFFAWLERRRYKVQARTLIARYRRFDDCPVCNGSRLKPDALCVRVRGSSIADLCERDVDGLRGWLARLELTPAEAARVERLLESLRERVETVHRVGLGYVGIDRQTRTLSGGEAQRIQLATALGGRLTGSLYVLDEPSIGLHPSDVERLLAVLRRVRDHGNTLVVVEHEPEIVAAADQVIDLGPAAGSGGGEIVVAGSVAEVRAHPRSATARALRGELTGSARPQRPPSPGSLRVVGAREHNLRGLTVESPLGRLVVVTGVSGAGKSTLVERVLVGNLLALQGEAEAGQRGEPGACDAIEGAGRIEAVVVVDQSPSSRSPRSNPATVSKAFDVIRTRFAETREAKALGVGPGWFSFNVAGGRCETCEGAGERVIDMQFLDDVRVPCDVCGGTRYQPEVLQVRLDGRTIIDVLALTVDEALEVFSGDRRVVSRLQPFARVGLGYLQLGQPLSTLSGGEHQRVRLGLALSRRRARGRGRGASPGAETLGTRLVVLDEPTTGLHPVDVEVLLGCLDALIAEGDSVLVVEHNLDVIRRADWVLDLGPGGGPAGGQLVVAGTPDEVAVAPGSATGRALASALGSSQPLLPGGR